MNNTANPPTSICSLESLCSFGGKPFLEVLKCSLSNVVCKDFTERIRINGSGKINYTTGSRGILTVTQVYNAHFHTRWPGSLASQYGCASLFIWSGKYICYIYGNMVIVSHIDRARDGLRWLSHNVLCCWYFRVRDWSSRIVTCLTRHSKQCSRWELLISRCSLSRSKRGHLRHTRCKHPDIHRRLVNNSIKRIGYMGRPHSQLAIPVSPCPEGKYRSYNSWT